MPKKESYKSTECCVDGDCYMLDSEENEPCWGQVTVVAKEYTDDDDYWWIHACEGHASCSWRQGSYKDE